MVKELVELAPRLDKFVEEFRALPPEERQRLLEMLKRESPDPERARRAAETAEEDRRR